MKINKQLKAHHPCPVGYRRLKTNEIIRIDDLGNALENTMTYE